MGTIRAYRLRRMKQGWFVGNFTPSAYYTTACEVAYKRHRRGEHYHKHYQKTAVEINLVVKGRLQVGDTVYTAGDIFVVPPMVAIKPVFLTNVEVVVVKHPSLPQDKVVVEDVCS